MFERTERDMRQVPYVTGAMSNEEDMRRRRRSLNLMKGVMPFTHSFLRWVSGCLLLLTGIILSMLILYATYRLAWKGKEMLDLWIVLD